MKGNKLNFIKDKEINFFLLFLFYIYVLFLIGFTPSLFLIFSGVAAILLFGWLIYVEFKENSIKITPPLALFIIPFFMLGISSIYHGLEFSKQNYAVLGQTYISTSSIVVGYLMFATGLFFQFLGIQILRPSSITLSSYKDYKKANKIFSYFILFFIISKLAEEYLQLGLLQNFLNLVPLSILFFIAIKDSANLFTSYNYKRNSVIIGSLIIFMSNLIFLSKTSLVFSILPIFFFYIVHASKSKRYKIVFIMSITISAYLFFIQPFVTNARFLLTKQNQKATGSFLSSYILSGDYKIPTDIYRKTDNPVEILLQRMFEINAPAYIYELTNRTGFQDGRTFENIAISFVPRIIWPDKPEVPQGERFAADNFGLQKVNIGMLIVGELYWNFGFTGIVIGSLILGLLLGYLWTILNKRVLSNFIYFTLYFYLLQSSVGGSEFSAVFVGIIQLTIIYYLIRYFELFISHKK